MNDFNTPVTLEMHNVQLAPLQAEHANGLLEAASDGELWKLWYTSVPDSDNITTYIAIALQQQAAGTALPFVVIDKSTNSIIGCTRYLNYDADHRRVEIGATWYAKKHQKTHVNSICKFLLLRHAFEKLNAIAVEFRTHFFNQKSRTAIARLGAKQDGILRNHRVDDRGNLRDTVVFSIINSEWPTVKASLSHKIETFF